MKRTRLRVLALLALLGASCGWAIMSLGAQINGWPPAIALHGGIAAVVAALLILAFGYRVRRYQHDAKWVNPMRAALTVSAAQACAITGALATGGYLGALGFALGALGSPFMLSLRWNTGLCALGCLAWMVAGLIVERWCIVDNSDDSSEPGAGATA
ncbi:MAG: DUF3180 domain-containing protein [Actinomyces graevenitzii]|uniref:DUF3180 domain-containing protein n=1 Tax=Actinomyces graevenitzii C83 TaxID=435830 RepID=G9PGZ3_9ACTO|nr:DUF3180 domain-containing protein [Actinomyces graevenitzii]EHM87458.1 hypothetical protein HMPREF0045_01517 [Actinomyces graevenitzii C83]MBS6934547.1 DUF3180 domain-containing protein [Actinomyces graevenitzii]